MDKNNFGFLIFLAAILLIGLLIFVFIRRTIKNTKKDFQFIQQKLKHAVPAEAVILSVELNKGLMRKASMGCTHVTLHLQMEHQAGTKKEVYTHWEVEQTALNKLQNRTKISVKVDAEDPAIIYPAESWAKYNWG